MGDQTLGGICRSTGLVRPPLKGKRDQFLCSFRISILVFLILMRGFVVKNGGKKNLKGERRDHEGGF